MISKPGDVYLTRNTPEFNKTAGYWQHAAISVGWAVIEAQQEPGQVIMVLEAKFRERNPERVLLRPSKGGDQAAVLAFEYLGVPYDVKHFNCVTLVRLIYNRALNENFLWRSPGGIYRSPLFKMVEHYEDYKHWKKPDDWYDGRLV